MSLQIGRFRDQIKIEQRAAAGKNAANETVYIWTTWREPYCALEVRRGREHFDPSTKQRFGEDVYLFECHFSEVEGIDATMRILFGGKYFDIRSVRPSFAQRDCSVIEAIVQDGPPGGG